MFLGFCLLPHMPRGDSESQQKLWHAPFGAAGAALVVSGSLFIVRTLVPNPSGLDTWVAISSANLTIALALAIGLATYIRLPLGGIVLGLAGQLVATILVGGLLLPSPPGWGIPPVFLPMAALARSSWSRATILKVLGVLGVSLAVRAVAAWWPLSDIPAVAFVNTLDWLLAWPLLRILRPERVPAASTLSWQCLLLIPCWLSVSFPPSSIDALSFSIGAFPLLAIPMAVWITQRHGTRSLPAVALALAPMLVTNQSFFGGILNIRANDGIVLSALLVSKFVADRVFRGQSLSATRLSVWQILMLVAFPVSLAIDGNRFAGIPGFEVWVSGWTLTLTLSAMLGLSAVNLRQPIIAVVVGTLLAIILIPVLVDSPTFYDYGLAFDYQLRDLGALLELLLAFFTFRCIRGRRSEYRIAPFSERICRVLRRKAGPIALAAAILSFMISLNISIAPLPSKIYVIGLGSNVYLLLVFFWAASDISLFPGFRVRLRGHDIPLSLLIVIVFATAGSIISFHLGLGPLELRVGGYPPNLALGDTLPIFAFYRMALSFRPMLSSSTFSEAAYHPAFRTTPVRLGMGLCVFRIILVRISRIILVRISGRPSVRLVISSRDSRRIRQVVTPVRLLQSGIGIAYSVAGTLFGGCPAVPRGRPEPSNRVSDRRIRRVDCQARQPARKPTPTTTCRGAGARTRSNPISA